MGQNFDKREKAEPLLIDVQLTIPKSGALLFEFFFFKALPGEGLHHPVARDVLLRARVISLSFSRMNTNRGRACGSTDW